MKLTNTLAKIMQSLRRHTVENLITSVPLVLAGISVCSIGFLRLTDALQTWLSSGALGGEPFDIMMPRLIESIVLIAPAIIFFVIAYLLFESHSLGGKMALILSIGCLAAGVFLANAALTFAGVSSFLGAEILFLTRRKTKAKKDSPITIENVAKLGLLISGLIGVFILFGSIIYVAVKGSPFLTWDFITGSNWSLSNLKGFIEGTSTMGISHPVIGSFLVVGLCEFLAVPLGIFAAVYMAEYAPKNFLTSTIRFFIETLAGAPSIIIALFGYLVFVYGPLGWGVSWLSTSICLTFIALPWNIRVTEEAMITVPYSYREGCYALGATKWQTIRRVILLSASPGIITGIVLGLGAVLGETTVLILTSDLGQGSLASGLPLVGSGMVTLPVQIYRTIYYNIGGTGRGWDNELKSVAFAEGFVLLMLFLLITIGALVARNYLTKKGQGR
jgi:phosphate transport system permease protein